MDTNRQPTVSVILAALNEADYIAETIESVLKQNYPALELHVQDGGSSDKTVDVVKQYPVKYLVERDTGVPDAFNRGCRATTGEIVIFLGADDPLMPGSIQILVDTLTRNPDAGFAYGDMQLIDASGKPFVYMKSWPFDLDDMFWQNHVATQSVAMRRSALIDVGLYREGIYIADWDLWLRLGARYPSVYIPKLLARWRIHDRSTTLNNLGKYARSVQWVADSLLADPSIISRLRRGRPRAFAGSYLLATICYVLAGDMSEARGRFRQAFRAYPQGVFTRSGMSALVSLLLGSKLYYRVRNRGRGPG